MEAYIDHLWTCNDLKGAFEKILKTPASSDLKTLSTRVAHQLNRFINFQTIERSKDVNDVHYNLGNRFYEKLLGSTMQYSCGYWDQNSENEKDNSLTQSQLQKMDLVARKLKLTPECRVLDIGCGFGTLAKHLSGHCKQVVGITLSENQHMWATETFKDEIRSGKLSFILSDYRTLPSVLGKFDRVVSVGFLEHVGVHNLSTLSKIIDFHLKPDGIVCLHTIGKEQNSHETSQFIRKYIFPGGQLPTQKDIYTNFLPQFRMEDWHNFGKDYSKTLDAWLNNFSGIHFDDIKSERIWELYLTSCSAAFSVRKLQLWQIILTKKTSTIEYRSVR